MTDPILSELWEIKDGLAKEYGYDLRRLFDRLRIAQQSARGRVVNRSKRGLNNAENSKILPGKRDEY